MDTAPAPPRFLRFGIFELDPGSGELRRGGRRVPLQPRPAQVLAWLASRPGELVSREELRRALWGDGVHVEFDDALNTAMRQVRRALGDRAAGSRYVETVPRRGYRFVAAVEPVDQQPTLPVGVREKPRRWHVLAWAAALALLVAAIPLVRGWYRPARSATPPRLAVFPVETAEPGWQAAAGLLQEQTLLAVARAAGDRAVVLGRPATAGLGEARFRVDLERATGADYLLDASLRSLPDQRVRLHVKVIRARGSWILWGGDYDLPVAALPALSPYLADSIAATLLAQATLPRHAARPALPPAVSELFADAQAAQRAYRFTAAVPAYARASALAPADARPRAELALAHLQTGLAGQRVPWTAAYAAARSEAERALRLSPREPAALAALGGARLWLDRDAVGAERLLRQAVAGDDQLPLARVWLADALAAQGRHTAAAAALRPALQLLPLHPYLHVEVARLRFLAGDLVAAERAARLTLLLDPGNGMARRELAAALLATDRAGAAATEVLAPELRTSRDPWADRLAAAERAVTVGGDTPDLWLARVAALRRDEPAALRWLQRAEARHFDGLLYLRVDPAFAPLAELPEYRALVARVLPQPGRNLDRAAAVL